MATYTAPGGTGTFGTPSIGSGGGPSTTYTTLSSNAGNQYGSQVQNQVNQYASGAPQSYTDPFTGKTYYAGINPLTGQPWGQGPASGVGPPNQQGQNQGGQGVPQYSPGGNNQGLTGLGGTLNGNQVNTGGNQQNPPAQQPTSGQGVNPQLNAPQNQDNTPTTYQQTPQQTATLNQYDNYISQLTGLQSQTNTLFNQQLGAINAQFGMQKMQQQRENDMYAAGLRAQGAATGANIVTPQLLSGEINAAMNSGIQKLTDITLQQNEAVVTATQANIQEKMGILKQLSDLDTQKFQVAEQMKTDFYNNTEKQQQITQNKINMQMPSIYSQLKDLPPDQQTAAIIQLSQQMGVPAVDLQGAYQAYDVTMQKPLTDAYANMVATYGLPISQDQLYSMTPAQFQKILSANPKWQAEQVDLNARASVETSEAKYFSSITSQNFQNDVVGTGANQYIDLSNFTGQSQAMAQAWANNNGIKAFAGANATTANNLTTAAGNLSTISNLFTQAAASNPTISAAERVAGVPLGQLFQTGTQQAAYIAAYNSASQILKTLGVDPTKINQMLPPPGSNASFGQAQIDEVQQLLNTQFQTLGLPGAGVSQGTIPGTNQGYSVLPNGMINVFNLVGSTTGQ